jgi:hypothetical protein
MFMMAATTASIVLFRWIGSENVSSGSRLKASEAYQASESGLDAVRGWLANRAPDVGGMITQYERNRGPILLADTEQSNTSMLGSLGGARNQRYRVYLMGADIGSAPMKLKFMSVGIGRDDSRVSQTAIFSVNGLYKVSAPGNIPKCQGDDCDFDQAFFGGFAANTQGKFSSAIVNGDMTINGFTSNRNLLVTGSLSTMDNGDRRIGCPPAGSNDPPGDLYVGGNFNVRGFTMCGNSYIGGRVTTSTGPRFEGDLYAAGGITKGSPLTILGNLTLTDTLIATNNDGMRLEGNLVMDRYEAPIYASARTTHGNIRFFDDIFVNGNNLEVLGSVWIGENFAGTKRQDRGNNVKFGIGTAGPYSVHVPNTVNATGNIWRNTRQQGDATMNVHFQYAGTVNTNPSTTNPDNRPVGAANLESMANRIESCNVTNPNRPSCCRGGYQQCVPDPLELPAVTKTLWTTAANTLDEMANPIGGGDGSLQGISNACYRLLRRGDPNNNIEGKWLGCGNGSQTRFTEYVNQCYQDLRNYRSGELLYNDPSVDNPGAAQFLAVNMDGTCLGDPRGVLRGNFIFVFPENVSANIKLGETAQDAAVFIYLAKGATGTMAFTGSRNDGRHRNYFIFSDGDIAGASGSTTISGSIFLAHGSKSGSITDTDVNFNRALYETLLDAGILNRVGNDPDGDNPNNPDDPQNGGGGPIADNQWIPVSSRLSVKLESKQISSRTEELSIAGNAGLAPFKLVMPRVVHIAVNEFANPNPSLREYYSFMYLNGAVRGGEVNAQPTCRSHPDGPGSVPLGNSQPFAEGTYRCTFAALTDVSDFYLRVAGDKSNARVQFTPSGTTASVSDIENCRSIGLRASSPPAEGEFIVSVSLAQSTGNGWVITPMERCQETSAGRWNCTINSSDNPPVIDAFQVCLPENAANIDNLSQSTVLNITACSGCIASGEQVIVPRQLETDKVERRASLSANEQCPASAFQGEWVQVNPNYGVTRTNDEWAAEVGSAVTWSIVNIAQWQNICEVVGDTVASRRNLTVREGGPNEFTVNLRWLTAQVRVDGTGSIYLRTTNPDVPQQHRTEPGLMCNSGSPCTIYRGINYVVSSHQNEYAWSCTEGAAYCQNTTNGYDNILVASYNVSLASAHAIRALGDVTVKLETAPASKLGDCRLNRTSIRHGQIFENSDITHPDLLGPGRGCTDANTSLHLVASNGAEQQFYGGEISNTIAAGSYRVIARSTACNTLDPAECGTLRITDATGGGCEYEEDWCGGMAFENVTKDITSNPNRSNRQCVFYSRITPSIQAGSGRMCVNGVCLESHDGWYNSPDLPPRKDMGYYVYCATDNCISQLNGKIAGEPDCGGVNEGGDCYDSFFCGGKPITAVRNLDQSNNTSANASTGDCFFLSSVDEIRVWNGRNVMVNGIESKNSVGGNVCGDDSTPQGDCHMWLRDIPKFSGGYYIYFTNDNGYISGTAGTRPSNPPECPVDPTISVTCTGISQTIPQGDNISTSDVNVTCSNGSTFTNLSVITSVNTSDAVGTTFNNLAISGRCGAALVEGICPGTITIGEPPSCPTGNLTMPGGGWNGGNPHADQITPAPGCYTLVCANGNAPFSCRIPTGSSVRIDGTTISNDGPNVSCNTHAGKIIEITGSGVRCGGHW